MYIFLNCFLRNIPLLLACIIMDYDSCRLLTLSSSLTFSVIISLLTKWWCFFYIFFYKPALCCFTLGLLFAAEVSPRRWQLRQGVHQDGGGADANRQTLHHEPGPERVPRLLLHQPRVRHSGLRSSSENCLRPSYVHRGSSGIPSHIFLPSQASAVSKVDSTYSTYT